jgi:hypothetical protein
MVNMCCAGKRKRRTGKADWFRFLATESGRLVALGRIGSHLVGFGEGFLVRAEWQLCPTEVLRGEEGFWRDFGLYRVWRRRGVGHGLRAEARAPAELLPNSCRIWSEKFALGRIFGGDFLARLLELDKVGLQPNFIRGSCQDAHGIRRTMIQTCVFVAKSVGKLNT